MRYSYDDAKIMFFVEKLKEFFSRNEKISYADKKIMMAEFDHIFGKQHSDNSKKMLIDNILSNWNIDGYTKFGLGSKAVQRLTKLNKISNL